MAKRSGNTPKESPATASGHSDLNRWEDEEWFGDPFDAYAGVDELGQEEFDKFPVSITDSRLRGFLKGLLEDPDVALPLSDWLEDRGDPRAEIVRDLGYARCVIPE